MDEFFFSFLSTGKNYSWEEIMTNNSRLRLQNLRSRIQGDSNNETDDELSQGIEVWPRYFIFFSFLLDDTQYIVAPICSVRKEKRTSGIK